MTGNLNLTNGGQVNASTFGQGNASLVEINARDTITINGENSDGFASSANSFSEAVGDAGGVTITTSILNLTNGGQVDASAIGQGSSGIITIQANALNLDNGFISSSAVSGEGGLVNLEIDNNITLRNDSLISAQAFNDANGGNVNIESNFIIAFPSKPNGSDILVSNETGRGGNVSFSFSDVLNLELRPAIPENGTNDIDISSGFDSIQISTEFAPDIGKTPENLVESEQTVAQACSRDRITGTVSGLELKGKGGIPPLPTEPMDSDAILVDGQISTSSLQIQPQNIKPIKTSQGDIYPARGIIKTENGGFILTAYPTDGIDTRTPHIRANCTQS